MAFIAKKKDRWYVVKYLDGKKVWQSLSKFAERPITNKKQAADWFKYWREDQKYRTGVDTSGKNQIKSFFDDYRRYCKNRNTATTYQTNLHRLIELESFCNQNNVRRIMQINLVFVEEFVEHKRSGRTGNVTINRLLEILRHMMNRAVDVEIIKHSPLARLKMLPATRRRETRSLSKEEIIAIRGKFPTPEREFCLLGIYAGLRRAEIVWLEWSNIDFQRRTISIESKPEFTPKGLRKRIIPVHPVLFAALRALPRHQRFVFDKGANIPLFYPNMWYKRIVPLFQAHEIENANLHTLRHTFVTLLANTGRPMGIARILAGHQDIKTTMQYYHSSDKQLREAINMLPG